jgi:hypothetical protein
VDQRRNAHVVPCDREGTVYRVLRVPSTLPDDPVVVEALSKRLFHGRQNPRRECRERLLTTDIKLCIEQILSQRIDGKHVLSRLSLCSSMQAIVAIEHDDPKPKGVA